MITNLSNFSSTCALALLMSMVASQSNAGKPNVLFIAVDDLKPLIQSFGDEHAAMPKVWDLRTHFRPVLPNVVTLPQRFKNTGYTTVGMGKIYDPRSASGGTRWARLTGPSHS